MIILDNTLDANIVKSVELECEKRSPTTDWLWEYIKAHKSPQRR